MTAKEVLDWVGFSQGTATKAAILRVWNAFRDEDQCIWVGPNSSAERAGLKLGNNYTMGSALAEIGCEEKA